MRTKGKLDDDESTPAQKKPPEQLKPIKKVKSDNKPFSSSSDTFKNVASIDEAGSSKTGNVVLSVETQNPLIKPQDLAIATVLTDSNTKTSENSSPIINIAIAQMPDAEKTASLKPPTSLTNDVNSQTTTPSVDDAKITLLVGDDDINDFSTQNSTDAFDIGQLNKESTFSKLIKYSDVEYIEKLATQFSPGVFDQCVDSITKDDISMETLDVNDTQLTDQETDEYKNIIKDANLQQKQQQTSSQSQDVTFQTVDMLFNPLNDMDTNRTPGQIKNDNFVESLTEHDDSSPQTQTQTPHGDSSTDTVVISPIISKKPQKRKSDPDTATKSTGSKQVSKKSKGDLPVPSQLKVINEELRLKLKQKVKQGMESMNVSADLESDKTDTTSSSVASIENVIPQKLVDVSASSTNVSSSNFIEDNIVSVTQSKPNVTITVEATKTPISSPEIDVVATTSKEEKIIVLPASTSSNIAVDANVVVSDRDDITITVSLPATTSTGITTTTTTIVSGSSGGVTTATVADTTKTNTPITITSVSENVTSSTSTATATPGNLTNFVPTTTTSVSQNENVKLTTSTATATSGNITDVVPTTTTSVSQNVTSTADTATTIPTTITKNTPTTTGHRMPLNIFPLVVTTASPYKIQIPLPFI